MTRIVKAILIDPFACTVTEVEHDASGIDGIHKLLSHEAHPVDCFACAYADTLAPGDAIFVDDEGLLKAPERFFLFPGNPQPLAGKGLVLGSDGSGETTKALTPLVYIRDTVRFLVRDEFSVLVRTREPWQKA